MDDKALERRLDELRKLAGTYAKSQATREHLEEFKKSKLALLMKDAEKAGFASAAAQEREARADDAYIALLDVLKTAVEDAERARWELRIAELGAGLWQTLEATKRAEMKAYGG